MAEFIFGGKQINGNIDFSTKCIGDSAADFASILYDYGETVPAKMAKSYSAIENSIDRIRFWAGTLPLKWTLDSWQKILVEYNSSGRSA